MIYLRRPHRFAVCNESQDIPYEVIVRKHISSPSQLDSTENLSGLLASISNLDINNNNCGLPAHWTSPKKSRGELSKVEDQLALLASRISRLQNTADNESGQSISAELISLERFFKIPPGARRGTNSFSSLYSRINVLKTACRRTVPNPTVSRPDKYLCSDENDLLPEELTTTDVPLAMLQLANSSSARVFTAPDEEDSISDEDEAQADALTNSDSSSSTERNARRTWIPDAHTDFHTSSQLSPIKNYDSDREEDLRMNLPASAYLLSPKDAMLVLGVRNADRRHREAIQQIADQEELEQQAAYRDREDIELKPFLNAHKTLVRMMEKARDDQRMQSKSDEAEVAQLLEDMRQRNEKANTELKAQLQRLRQKTDAENRTSTAVRDANESAQRAQGHMERALQAWQAAEGACQKISAQLEAKKVTPVEKKADPEKSVKEPQVATQEAAKLKVEPPDSQGDVFAEAIKEADARIALLNAAKETFKSVSPEELLKLRMKIQKEINQIASTQSQVLTKVESLKKILREAPSDALLQYGLVTMAQALCDKAISMVLRYVKSAFSFAWVVFLLGMDFPPLHDLFLATLYQSCIYCVPRYLNRKDFSTLDAYMRALGFAVETIEDPAGKKQCILEDEMKYFERMRAYVSLYAAYVQIERPNHPHGARAGWQWCARLLNVEPRTATSTVLHAFLEVAGYQMAKCYRLQFRKLMKFVFQDFLPLLSAKASKTTHVQSTANQRLQLFLQNEYFMKNEVFSVPEGRDIAEMQRTQASDSSIQKITDEDSQPYTNSS